MRYHDFRLREYRVSDFGKRIALHLEYDYAGKPKDESHIEFADVALYNFTHTGGAIITDIEEATLVDLFREVGGVLVDWNRRHGVTGWKTTLEELRATLESDGFKAWRIESAIGFSGFVVAKAVRQVTPNTSFERTREG
jgi:hypothetical protein